MIKLIFNIILIAFINVSLFAQLEESFIVGSKKFTENVILGEIIKALGESSGAEVKHLKELGGTRVLWDALLKGDIDIYPDYTGTLKQEILSSKNFSDDEELINYLSSIGINISNPIGFNNTYAIGVKKETAEKYDLKKISDLKNHPELRFGFSNEFLNRSDGWIGLRSAYDLPQKNVTGLDHDLAYRGLDASSIDVIEFYSTDAEIKYYNLVVLDDDLDFFPEYNAVLLYRDDLKKSAPTALAKILELEGSIDEDEMIKMNARVKLEGETESSVAASFVNSNFGLNFETETETFWDRLYKHTADHLLLVLISLSAAIIISIPLGIVAHKKKKLGKVILSVTGIIQTIPSLALLVFMIPLLGIGSAPAIFALFLYSLLPIVRNTFLSLEEIPIDIKESADALGLKSFAKLRLIELPLSFRSILAGIKTSAVINVGTATLGALIGAGGYGQPILTGIRLDNIPLILEGAVPAALLALIVQWFFDRLELLIVPRGLRL